MLTKILSSLSQLSYAETMALAEHIVGEIEHSTGGANKLTVEVVAEILAKAQSRNKIAMETKEKEAKILLQAFTRKRVVNVKKFNTGYAIEVPTLPGSTVTGTDLRAMFSMMLDQIITMELLGGGSTRGK